MAESEIAGRPGFNSNTRHVERRASDRQMPNTFRVEIDRNRCQGHARCAALAPEIFSVDDEGNGQVLHDGPISSDLLDQANLARNNCPEIAIRIVEQDT